MRVRLIAVLLLIALPFKGYALVSERLFFVGQDLRVLTVASGRAEMPDKAPAIATVITSDDIERGGYRTLADVLSSCSGFYIAKREWGSELYLRGVLQGPLFLYDGVPLTSDSTKSIYPLDDELNIYALKRVEIVKGPSSVLWGPDAFSGVINLVPKTGKDLNGVEVGLLGESPFDGRGFFLNAGKRKGKFSGFVSIYSYWRRPYLNHYNVSSSGDRVSRSLKTQEYYDLLFNFTAGDALQISGRWSDYRRNFTMMDFSREYSWKAEKKNPFSYLKAEYKKIWDSTSLRLKGYYSYLKQKKGEMNVYQSQKSRIYFAGFMLNRELFDKRGILTLGASYRYNKVSDAVLRVKGAVPDFISPENKVFKPIVEEKSFDTDLFSSYLQYRHHIDKWEFWLGLRYDNHSDYKDRWSYNAGVMWYPTRSLYFKAIYGVSYRTPYAVQFVGRERATPEEMRSLNLQVGYRFKGIELKLTPFYSKIKNHVLEDPFGGYSLPGRREFLGTELEFIWKISDRFKLWTNLTAFSSWGDDEDFKVLKYIFITPEGEKDYRYEFYSKDFDQGPQNIANIGFDWNITSKWHAWGKLSYTGSRVFSYLKEDYKKYLGSQWLFDASLDYKICKNFKVRFLVKNLFNNRYKEAGTYSIFESKPARFYFILKGKF